MTCVFLKKKKRKADVNIFGIHTHLLKSLSQNVREDNLLGTVLEMVFDNGISTGWMQQHGLVIKKGQDSPALSTRFSISQGQQ